MNLKLVVLAMIGSGKTCGRHIKDSVSKEENISTKKLADHSMDMQEIFCHQDFT